MSTKESSIVELLKELEVKQSMSRKGNCWDKSKAESFFGHFKCETIYLMKNPFTQNYLHSRFTTTL